MVIALVLLLLNDGDSEPEAITTITTVATTTTASTATTTTVPETTTSLDPDARLAEVERILEDLNIAWYDAVYRKDETVLPDIVATSTGLDSAIQAMDVAQFLSAPSAETVIVTALETLLDRPDCLVVHHRLDVSHILPDAEPVDRVQILWPTDQGSYRLARLWSSPADLWQDDCNSVNRDEIP